MTSFQEQWVRLARLLVRDRKIRIGGAGRRPTGQKYPKAVSVVHDRPEGAAPAGFGGDRSPKFEVEPRDVYVRKI